jgi:hypothetical protein
MFRTVLKSALALSLIGGSAMALSASPAFAGKPTITAGAGSSISCDITASIKLSVPLKNDWVQADHSSDPVAAVAAIVDTQFGADGPEIVTIKGSGTCTGTVTDGTNNATVTGVKFSVTNDPSHLGNTTEATCAGLLSNTPPSTSEYDSTISYTSSGDKVAPTTVTDQVIPAGTFNLTGGTISGSFAGSSGSIAADGTPDSNTVNSILQAAPTSSSPTPAYPDCQPTLSVKVKKGVTTATLKAPKGLKKISMVSGSTLTASA